MRRDDDFAETSDAARFYKVTLEGKRVLAQQRKTWAAFVEAVRRVTGDEHA